MKINVILLLFFLNLVSCSSNDEIAYYFNKNEADELFRNMVTFVSEKPGNATLKSRFSKDFYEYYQKNSSKFQLKKIKLENDNFYYFWMNRPVANSLIFKRGVIGRFKLHEGSMMPFEFEETINTPPLKENEINDRCNFLYNEFRRNKSLEKFIKMKHYVEWPDSSLVYDKKTNAWIRKKNP